MARAATSSEPETRFAHAKASLIAIGSLLPLGGASRPRRAVLLLRPRRAVRWGEPSPASRLGCASPPSCSATASRSLPPSKPHLPAAFPLDIPCRSSSRIPSAPARRGRLAPPTRPTPPWPLSRQLEARSVVGRGVPAEPSLPPPNRPCRTTHHTRPPATPAFQARTTSLPLICRQPFHSGSPGTARPTSMSSVKN